MNTHISVQEEYVDAFEDEFNNPDVKWNIEDRMAVFKDSDINIVDFSNIDYSSVSLDQVENFLEDIDWELLSRERFLPLDFIEKYRLKLDMKAVSGRSALTMEFIEEYSDELDWKNISSYQHMTMDFMINHVSKLVAEELEYNTFINLSEKDLNFLNILCAL